MAAAFCTLLDISATSRRTLPRFGPMHPIDYRTLMHALSIEVVGPFSPISHQGAKTIFVTAENCSNFFCRKPFPTFICSLMRPSKQQLLPPTLYFSSFYAMDLLLSCCRTNGVTELLCILHTQKLPRRVTVWEPTVKRSVYPQFAATNHLSCRHLTRPNWMIFLLASPLPSPGRPTARL